MMSAQRSLKSDPVAFNRQAHQRIAPDYESFHGEIYNEVEQSRLAASIERSAAMLRSHGLPLRALDYGCGAGNLSGHLLRAGFEVVAADIAPSFLNIVTQRYRGSALSTVLLNGHEQQFAPGEFTFVGVYSVLHHIPEYLPLVERLASLIRPGGLLYIDHEFSPGYWNKTPEYQEYVRLCESRWHRERVLKYFDPRRYYYFVRRLWEPRYQPHGDIHVWSDDHIEWKEIEKCLSVAHFKVEVCEDYLLFHRHHEYSTYLTFKDRCDDMRVMIARRLV